MVPYLELFVNSKKNKIAGQIDPQMTHFFDASSITPTHKGTRLAKASCIP